MPIKLTLHYLDEVPTDQRFWEWHYLKRKAGGSLFTLYGHADKVCVPARDRSAGLTAAEGQAIAAKAMDVLRRAVDGGWRNVAHMRTDTDLDALRQREDFQKLMQELEAKGKAGGP
jgi:hypothetical protein